MKENLFEVEERKAIAAAKAERDRNAVQISGWVCCILGLSSILLMHGQLFCLCAIVFGIVTVCRNKLQAGMMMILIAVIISTVGWGLYWKLEFDKADREIRKKFPSWGQ